MEGRGGIRTKKVKRDRGRKKEKGKKNVKKKLVNTKHVNKYMYFYKNIIQTKVEINSVTFQY